MKDTKALLRRFLPLICAVVLLAASFLPHQETRSRLRLVPGMWPAAEPLLVAGDLQILPPDRFQIIEIPWSSAVARAFGSGAADVAIMTLDGVVRMREAGQKLKVLRVLSQSSGSDALLARQNIRRLQDLKGKRVGVERSAGAYLLVNALESAGMSVADVESVPMFQSEMEQALVVGQVEAVVVMNPWRTKLSQEGMRLLYDSSQLKIPILYLLVASERACNASRKELLSLLKIQSEMTDKIWTGKPFKGMDAVLRRETLNADELASCLRQLRPLNQSEGMEMLNQLPQMAAEMEEQMIRTGIINTRPAGGEWIDRTIMKEALP